MTQEEWLQQLKRGDVVLVRNGQIHFPGTISNVTPKFLFIGKLKFHKRDGSQVKRQRARVYRMNLRLVMSESTP